MKIVKMYRLERMFLLLMITLISSPKQLIATTVHKFQEKGTPPLKKPRKAILLEELPDNTNIQLAKNEKGLFVDDSGFIHVYTDGACSKNGQLGKMVKKSFISDAKLLVFT